MAANISISSDDGAQALSSRPTFRGVVTYPGNSVSGHTVTLLVNGSPAGSTTTDANGLWEIQASSLSAGIKSVSAELEIDLSASIQINVAPVVAIDPLPDPVIGGSLAWDVADGSGVVVATITGAEPTAECSLSPVGTWDLEDLGGGDFNVLSGSVEAPAGTNTLRFTQTLDGRPNSPLETAFTVTVTETEVDLPANLQVPNYAPPIFIGHPYKYTFATMSPTTGDAFAVASGTLPTGATFTSAGVLSMTAAQTSALVDGATYPFDIRVTNSAGTGVSSIPLRVMAPVAATSGRVAQIVSRIGGTQPAYVPNTHATEMQTEADDPAFECPTATPTHIAVASGSWSSTSTWDVGTVPATGSTVEIPAGKTVTYDVESDEEIVDIFGSGVFRLSRLVDLKLIVDSICMEENGGEFDWGNAGNYLPNSATLGKPRCDVIFKSTQAPLTTIRLGAMGHRGTKARWHGAPKETRVFATATIAAGAQSCIVTGNLANWRKDDNILFVATDNAGSSATDSQYTAASWTAVPPAATGTPNPTNYFMSWDKNPQKVNFKLSHDEVRPIDTLTDMGNDVWVVTWVTPLAWDHTRFDTTLLDGTVITDRPCVAMLSHSIRLSSYDPTVRQNRAHVMFMHTSDVDIRYVEFQDMGRTDTSPTLTRPSNACLSAVDFTTSLKDPNNVRGRYALHFHGGGPYFGEQMSVAKGNSFWAPTAQYPQPGWVLVGHNHRHAFEENVLYNFRGAGLVTERGNEIGQWLNNVIAWGRGDGFKTVFQKRSEHIENHNGHAGVGMECQARQILIQGNIVSSCHDGVVYLQTERNDATDSGRQPHHLSLRLFHPGAGNKNYSNNPLTLGTYGIEQAQIPDWNDNVFYGLDRGFYVAHRVDSDRADTTPMLSKRYRCYGVGLPFHVEAYSWNYTFRDFVWKNGLGGQCIRIQDKTHNFNFVNGATSGYATFQGTNANNAQSAIKGTNGRGHVCDVTGVPTNLEFLQEDFTGVTLSPSNGGYTGDQMYQNPSLHPLGEIDGPWQKLGNLRIYPRIAHILDSATELVVRSPTFTQDTTGQKTTESVVNALDGSPGFKVSGTITDTFGSRVWPEWYWWSPKADDGYYNYTQSIEYAAKLLQRNGAFQSGSTWKMPCYFREQDKFHGTDFTFRIDITLTSFATADLQANQWPNNTPVPPDALLLPEAI